MFRITLLAHFFAEVSQPIHRYPLQPYLLAQLISAGPRKAGEHSILLEQFPSLTEEGHRSDNSGWHLCWPLVTPAAGPVCDTVYAHLPTSSLHH